MLIQKLKSIKSQYLFIKVLKDSNYYSKYECVNPYSILKYN